MTISAERWCGGGWRAARIDRQRLDAGPGAGGSAARPARYAVRQERIGRRAEYVDQAPIIGDSGGNVQLEYKGSHGAALRATTNIPINDISALRVSGLTERNEGLLHNVYTGEDSLTKNSGARVRYLLKPNSDVTLNLIAEASNSRSENAVFFAPAVASVTNTAGNHQPLAEFAACGVTVSKTNNQVCSDGGDDAVRGFSGHLTGICRTAIR
jgi:iron complex outermembrane receptor protein